MVDSACHTEGEERFPSKPVAPAPNIEREEDGHGVLGDGDDVVEADHLSLDLSVDRLLGVLFYVGAILSGQVESLL